MGISTAGLAVEMTSGWAVAWVSGQMAQNYADARTQDLRWEGGRLRLTNGALRVAVKRLCVGDIRGASAAAEVASPPLTLVVLGSAFAAALGFARVGSKRLGFASAGLTGLSVGLGLIAARASKSDLAALVYAPVFVAHKLRVYSAIAFHRAPEGWVRTNRS